MGKDSTLSSPHPLIYAPFSFPIASSDFVHRFNALKYRSQPALPGLPLHLHPATPTTCMYFLVNN